MSKLTLDDLKVGEKYAHCGGSIVEMLFIGETRVFVKWLKKNEESSYSFGFFVESFKNHQGPKKYKFPDDFGFWLSSQGEVQITNNVFPVLRDEKVKWVNITDQIDFGGRDE